MQISASKVQKEDIPHTKEAGRIGKTGNRADRIHQFNIFRKAGYTLTEIAKRIGVCYGTVQNYEKVYRQTHQRDYVDSQALSAIADKAETAGVLTSIIRSPDIAERDKIQAVKVHAELMGHNAPARSENLTIHVYPSTLDLLASVRAERLAALASGAQRAIGAGGSPQSENGGDELAPPEKSPKNFQGTSSPDGT